MWGIILKEAFATLVKKMINKLKPPESNIVTDKNSEDADSGGLVDIMVGW